MLHLDTSSQISTTSWVPSGQRIRTFPTQTEAAPTYDLQLLSTISRWLASWRERQAINSLAVCPVVTYGMCYAWGEVHWVLHFIYCKHGGVGVGWWDRQYDCDGSTIARKRHFTSSKCLLVTHFPDPTANESLLMEYWPPLTQPTGMACKQALTNTLTPFYTFQKSCSFFAGHHHSLVLHRYFPSWRNNSECLSVISPAWFHLTSTRDIVISAWLWGFMYSYPCKKAWIFMIAN